MLTTNDCYDNELLPVLIEAIAEPIPKLGNDRAYEGHHNYAYLEKRQIEVIIQSRKDTRIKQYSNYKAAVLKLDEIIRAIITLERKGWKEGSD